MDMTAAHAFPDDPWLPEDSFKNRLITLRRELGMTIEQIAGACGYATPTWATWERGVIPRRMHEVVAKIAATTHVDQDWLMWGEGDGRRNRGFFPLEIVPHIEGQMELALGDMPALSLV